MLVPKLRFKEFTDEWKSYNLKEILVIKNGLNKEKEFFGKGTPIVNYMDINKNAIITSKKVKGKVTLSQKEISNFLVKKGDIFFTRTSETSEEIGLASSLVENIDNCVFSGFILKATPINDTIFAINFPGYYFRTDKSRKEIIKHSSITTRALTSGTLLYSMNISIPIKQEQTKIANTLELLDKKIELQIDKIEALKLYKKGIINILYFNNNWEKKAFKNIYVKASEGGTPSTNILSNYQEGTIPFVKIADLSEKYLLNVKNYITLKGLNSSSAWIVPKKSIIFSNGATIGACSINEIDVATKQGILGIIPKENICSEFLYYSMISLSFRKQLKKIITKGTMECAYIKDIDNIILGVPSMAEQINIIKPLIAIDKKIENEIKKLSNLSKFKEGLLQQMFV